MAVKHVERVQQHGRQFWIVIEPHKLHRNVRYWCDFYVFSINVRITGAGNRVHI